MVYIKKAINGKYGGSVVESMSKKGIVLGVTLSISDIAIIISRMLVITLLALIFMSAPVFAQSEGENKLKVAYLIKITKMIKWSHYSSSAPGDTFTVTIVGKSSMETWIKKGFTRKVQGKKGIVNMVSSLDEISHSDVVIIGESERAHKNSHIKKAQGLRALIVGDGDDFFSVGGHLRFYKSENKVRFDLNPEEMEKSGLKAKAFLLDYVKKMRGAK